MSGAIEIEGLPGWRRRKQLAYIVLRQLEEGASSGVNGPGLLPVRVENCLLNQEVDPPRVLDTLLKAVRDKVIAGPFKKAPDLCRRINSFLSIPKPGGDRRQVGDLSQSDKSKGPVDKSFNGNVDPSLKSVWPLNQLNAKQFSRMIRSMGVGARMGKSDLTQAYKNIPVAIEQRKLQRFMFGERIFEELRLIFGDTYAPMFFDRFHHVIIVAFVTAPNDIPRSIWGKCIDDIPVVVPANRIDLLTKFFRVYKDVCNNLNVKLCQSDDKTKCFEDVTEGVVLGIKFDTIKMIWNLTQDKKNALINSLRELIYEKEIWNVKQWEKMNGRLNYICQLWPPGNFFMDSFLKALERAKIRGRILPNKRLLRDARVWFAVIKKGDLPIFRAPYGAAFMHIETFSDASGEILDSPGIGILIPSQFGWSPRVAAWEFPKGFLNSVDEKGKKCHSKTTCLEAIGMISVLLLAPDLLRGHCVVHTVDNIATVLAWGRDRSSADQWATTFVRATAHVCAYLNVDLHLKWQRRRSDRYTRVVDNLSHDRCEELNQEELDQYLKEPLVGFPDPLLRWMRSPRIDYDLGIHLVNWLKTRI